MYTFKLIDSYWVSESTLHVSADPGERHFVIGPILALTYNNAFIACNDSTDDNNFLYFPNSFSFMC